MRNLLLYQLGKPLGGQNHLDISEEVWGSRNRPYFKGQTSLGFLGASLLESLNT